MFGQKPLHIHFRCNDCGSLIDIDNKELNVKYINLNNRIEDKYDIDIIDTDILFKGICNKCREKSST